jgi:hypothetical protein
MIECGGLVCAASLVSATTLKSGVNPDGCYRSLFSFRRPQCVSLRSGFDCACRKSNPDILVVQPAESWAAKNLPGSFDGTRDRRILLQR